VKHKIIRNKTGFIGSAAILLIMLSFVCCQAAEYREIETSSGKVITGIDKAAAFKQYGLPDSARNDFWHYSSPESFFIYFPDQKEQVYLYPRSCGSAPGELIEFKVFAGSPETGITDVTSQAKIMVSQPKAFKFVKNNVVISLAGGEYQAFARYNGIFSNASYLSNKQNEQKEKKLIIAVLPYKPDITTGRIIEFTALWVMPDYIVKDISDKVSWFIHKGNNITSFPGRGVSFPSDGDWDVFCEYEDSKSAVQEARVRNRRFSPPHVLKNMLLLPELVKLEVKQTVFLKVFGTYYDNRVEDITARVRWMVSDKKVGDMLGNGVFYARTPGSTEIIADFNGRLKSLPMKIVVKEAVTPKSKNNFKPDKPPPASDKDKKKDQDDEQDTSEQDDAASPAGKEEPGRASDGAAKKTVRLIRIKVSPDGLKLSSGKEAKLKAAGIYSDGTEKDITLSGKWAARDEKIAVVAKGKLSGLSAGKTSVTVKMKDVESEPVLVTVTGPDLLSIIVNPQKARLSRLDRLELKARGYYSDASFKDITLQASWVITGRRIIKIDKARVIPSGFGKSEIHAEYAGVRSLPVSIEIIFTWAWFWRSFCVMLGYLSLAMFLLFFTFYLMIKYKVRKIRELKASPREFIFAVYANLKDVMGIFSFPDRPGQAPLIFARLSEGKFAVKDRAFISLTDKFEEARYSRNYISPEDAKSAGLCYDKIINDILVNYGKGYLLLKYIQALAKRTPFLLKTAKC